MAWTVEKIAADCKKMCKEYHENQRKLTTAKFQKFEARFESKHRIILNFHYGGDGHGRTMDYSVEVDDIFVVKDVRVETKTKKGFLGIEMQVPIAFFYLKRSDGDFVECSCKDVKLARTVNRGDKLRIKGTVDVVCHIDYYCRVAYYSDNLGVGEYRTDYLEEYRTNQERLRMRFCGYPKITRLK